MKCPNPTFVLFQYDGMIRATGILLETVKTDVADERGVNYSGYYRFDIESLNYLSEQLMTKSTDHKPLISRKKREALSISNDTAIITK